jgi:hypothetical protein
MTRDTEQDVKPCKFVNGACVNCEATERGDCQGWVSSPKRKWVGLTPEEILDLFDINNVYGSKWIEFARTVEAKLKERNT